MCLNACSSKIRRKESMSFEMILTFIFSSIDNFRQFLLSIDYQLLIMSVRFFFHCTVFLLVSPKRFTLACFKVLCISTLLVRNWTRLFPADNAMGQSSKLTWFEPGDSNHVVYRLAYIIWPFSFLWLSSLFQKIKKRFVPTQELVCLGFFLISSVARLVSVASVLKTAYAFSTVQPVSEVLLLVVFKVTGHGIFKAKLMPRLSSTKFG